MSRGNRKEETRELIAMAQDALRLAAAGGAAAAPRSGRSMSDQFQAMIAWLDDQPLFPGRAYDMKIGARSVTASVTDTS